MVLLCTFAVAAMARYKRLALNRDFFQSLFVYADKCLTQDPKHESETALPYCERAAWL